MGILTVKINTCVLMHLLTYKQSCPYRLSNKKRYLFCWDSVSLLSNVSRSCNDLTKGDMSNKECRDKWMTDWLAGRKSEKGPLKEQCEGQNVHS